MWRRFLCGLWVCGCIVGLAMRALLLMLFSNEEKCHCLVGLRCLPVTCLLLACYLPYLLDDDFVQ